MYEINKNLEWKVLFLSFFLKFIFGENYQIFVINILTKHWHFFFIITLIYVIRFIIWISLFLEAFIRHSKERISGK